MIEKFLGTYSNGWGHLIVTVTTIVSLSLLLASNKIDVVFAGGVLSSVLMFWFGTGVANRLAQVKNESPTTPNSPLIPQTQPTTPPLNAPNQVETGEEPTGILKVVKGKKNAA